MAIGKLKWFGGINNKTEKINNFGFISLLENNEISEIYVNRSNISQDLQDLFENSNSEGIYLEFEIDNNGKSQQAVNVNLMTFVGEVEWFRNARGYIKCEERADVKIYSSKIFYPGSVLYFAIRYNSKSKKDEAILVQKIHNLTDNLEVIQKCLNSNNFQIFSKFIPQYLQYIKGVSLDEAALSVQNKLSSFSNEGIQQILSKKILDEYPDLFLAKLQLCRFLNLNDYCELINNYLNSNENQYRQELIDEIITKLRECSELEKIFCWQKILYLQNNLQYQNYLWKLAIPQYQKPIIINKFKKFFQFISDFKNSDYPYCNFTSEKGRTLYNFDDNDKKLMQTWDFSVHTNDYNAAKMMSARSAEKLVIHFARALGYKEVEDISIHQITQKSKDWIKGDIKIGNQVLLDVKNARSNVNSKFYSEFCVPNFKKNRGKDVTIVAVLSPYLQKEYMLRDESLNFYKQNPQILGTCQQQEIQHLENIFSDTIIKINISRDLDDRNYLPPWVFDYNDIFYDKQIKIIQKFKDLQDNEMPPWEDLLIGTDLFDVFSLFIVAKRNIPQEWLENLPKWQVNFINNLIKIPLLSPRVKITLPYLFLFLLKHFLSMLSYEGNDYNPKDYQQIFSTQHPLKIYDPLNIIHEFCNSLQIIWNNRENANLNQFKIFKFNGRGLLQAKRFEGGKLTTLLAYCGGKIEKKGKCGYTPLVVGKHNTCLQCGRLICPKDECGYCSQDCLSYLQKKGFAKNSDRIGNV